MVPVLPIGDRRLGAILLEQGYVTDPELQRALEQQSKVGGRLADVLIGAGVVTERRIARAIEDALNIPLVDLVAAKPQAEATALLEGRRATEWQAFPFAVSGETLRVAFVDPLDTTTVEAVEDATGFLVEPYQALREQMRWAIASHYPELGFPVPDIDNVAKPEDNRLGRRLVRRGLVTESQLEEALAQQEPGGDPLGSILANLGYLSEERLYEILAEQYSAPYLPHLKDVHVDQFASGLISRDDALKMQAVPLRDEPDGLVVVLADPRRVDDLRTQLSRPIKLTLSKPEEIERLIERVYPERELAVAPGKEPAAREARVPRKPTRSKPLSEVLVELGYTTTDEVERAMARQRSGGGRLEDTLVQSGRISQEMLSRSLAVHLGYEYINPSETPPDPSVVLLVPEQQARRHEVFPMWLEGNSLVVAMKDPRNVFALDDLKLLTGRDIIPAVAPAREIALLIDRYYSSATDVNALNKELQSISRAQAPEEAIDPLLDDNAVVRTVNSVIREAVRAEASDIHVEPTEDHILVRTRIDGRLRDYMTLPKAAGPSIAARIKIMTGLDIAERRIPQDGRLRFKDKTFTTDLRVSTLPIVYGEKIVMRILQRASNIPEVEDLGFSDHNFQAFLDTIRKPYGIILMTGPTGSGKSYTTFSILKRVATSDRNTTTIEDPVEYEIPGINQTQVNNAAGMTFARALRAFLRQDPDIIMVGEIRDTETAKLAAEAALTGHLVIATLHTNDSAGAITRLDEMGVELFNISAALIGVVAQRLVRRICTNCKVEIAPDPDVLRRLGLKDEEMVGAKLYKGVGCEKCSGTGYRGRMAIHELLVVDDKVRHAIVAGKSSTEIKETAMSGEEGHQLRTLRQDGVAKALQGLTTLEEILSATVE
jgi:type IV pilus assembly protein PilB